MFSSILVKLILTIASLWVAYLTYIIVNNPEINWKLIVGHYSTYVLSLWLGIGGDFKRERSAFFFGLFYPKNKVYLSKKIVLDEVYINATYNNTLNETLKLVIISPDDYENKNKKFPILFNLHGGGWVIEGNGAKITDYGVHGIIVIDVHYRLAPEHKFPTAPEDAFTALEWLNTQAHPYLKNADLNNISVMGESAGGNLAAVLCVMARDRNITIKIKKQILLYPSFGGINYPLESHIKYEFGFILHQQNGLWFMSQYLNNKTELNHMYLNPTLNNDFNGIPSALFILAKHDFIYSEGIYYYERLQNNGIKVKLKEYSTVHGFYSLLNGDEDKEAFHEVVGYIKENSEKLNN